MRGGRWLVLAVLCASLLVVAMDATILNVALPSLIDDLQPDAVEQLWIIDVYGLVLGGLLVTAGAAGDRWGRKRLFVTGFLLFGAASVVAATAHSAEHLIAGRVLLGLGGAMVMPATLSMIRSVFPDPQERAVAIGIWSAVAGGGAAVGPVLGGVLVEHYGWQAAFWVNVPVVVVTVAAAVIVLPEQREPGPGRLDWLGAAMSVAGTIVLVWGIKHLPAAGGPAAGLFATGAGVGLLALFARRQLRRPDPLLDVRLFANRAFLAAGLVTLLAMMAIGAALFLLSMYLQYVQGLSPLAAGVRMLPAALSLLVASLASPLLVSRLGVRTVLALGLGALVVGFVLLAVLPLSYPVIALAMVAFGVGDGAAIVAATAVMVSAAPPERAGGAAAVEETCYELGVGFGVALLGSVAAVAYRLHIDQLPLAGADLATARDSIGGAVALASRYGGFAGSAVLTAARDAYTDALALTAAISALLVGAVTALALWLVPRPRARS